MKINHKLYILIVLIVVLISFKSEIKPQTVVPSCLAKDDCKVPIKLGYCGVQYDCVAGKCYNSFDLCSEECSGGLDEDKDTYIDCKDVDCWSSSYCPCSDKGFNECRSGNCYCESGIPRWVVVENKGGHWCQCM